MKLFNQLWDFFSSVKLAIFTLCSLALTSIVGTIIPQDESAAFYVEKFGAKTAHFFQVLDIPEMYYSWWFLGLLGILSTNLIICSLDRFPTVWKIVNADNLTIAPERIPKMANCRKWAGDASRLGKNNLTSLLQDNGWSPTSRKIDESEILFSQRGRWSRTGVYLVHLSILVIFVGAIIGHFFGFKGSVMVPELRSTQKVYSYKDSSSIDLGFEVRCDFFVIEFYDNGMPKEYRSTLTVLEDGKEVLKKDIEVNSPLSYKGITFYQSSYEGYQDFILTITENDSGDSKQFALPFQQQKSWEEKAVQFGIVNADAVGQRVTRSKVWFKSADTPAVIEWLADNESTTIKSGSKEYLISAKQMYATGLQVAKDPGVWVVYIGCGLMMLGLFMAFFMSHKRIWLYRHVDGDSATLYLSGSANKNKAGFTKIFNELEKRIDQTI
jgi:cytochrome c biogenesis protein